MTKAPIKTAKKKAAKKKALSPAPTGGGKILAFAMQRQELDNWCWAAVAASVGDYYAGEDMWQQCAIVNLELRRDDCCADGADGPCDVNGYLASALNRVDCLRNWAIATRAAFQVVVDELNDGRPVCVRAAWRGGGAHFMAITAYSDTDASIARVLVQDPFYVYRDIAWSDFLIAYMPVGSLQGDWTDTYYTQAPVVAQDGPQ